VVVSSPADTHRLVRALGGRESAEGGALAVYGDKRRGKARPDAPTVGVERYTQSNKFCGRAEPTKGDQQSGPRMSNILKPIDLTERAIRRAVFAVLDGF
jgi:hypothetical protein